MPKEKRNIFSRYFLLMMGVLALGLSCCWRPLFFSGTDQKAEGERIFKIFEGKEKAIRTEIDLLGSKLVSGAKAKELWSEADREDQKKHGLFYTVYAYDTLIYWNSSLVAFDDNIADIRQEGILKKLPTGWFYIFSKKVNDYTINGYMLIKRDFPYQNKYVQSAFHEDFHLSDQCEVVTAVEKGNIQVFCREGKFHFGIHFKQKPAGGPIQEVPVFLFFLFFVILVSAHFHRWIAGQELKPLIKFGFSIFFAGTFYLVLNLLKFPEEAYAGKLFTPFLFAWGKALSSLGDYLLLSFFLFFVAQSFFILLRKERNLSAFALKNLLFHIFAACYFVGSTWLFILLLNNSDLSLQLYNNFSLSLSNILASGCIALQMVGLGVILVRVRCSLENERSYSGFLLPALVSLGIILAGLLLAGIEMPFEAVIFYLFIVFLLDRTVIDQLSKFKLTTLLVFGMLLSFGLNLVSLKESAKKKSAVQQVLAVTLATERDPAAEIFLSDFETKVVKDSSIRSLMVPPYRRLESYLKENYFTGFWKNYELQVTVCESADSVFLPDERRMFPCLEFFNQLTLTKGVILPGSNFYFMDRLNGRISYLGELRLKDQQNGKPLIAFIELNSKIIPEGKGYPQLLMDQQASRRSQTEGYSYAKYFDNRLVDRGGSYLYDPVIIPGNDYLREFTYFEKGGYSHCVYKRSEANYVVVSYPIESLIEKGRGFPPLFLLIYIIGFGWLLFIQRMKFLPVNRMELRGKIQFTLVSTLLGLLFLIGFALIRYNYQEFQRSLKENLDQKVRAISSELGLRIGQSEKLDFIHDYLGDQLVEISDITWTDINIYDLTGKLAATSRKEIFEQGLTSERMNPQAYKALFIKGGATFLDNENLGRMKFFSVYAPLYNQTDELVGYVNLPYYNRQDDFSRQVSGFIIAFVNLYILLSLFTMVIALVISTKLTVPLLQIEQKLKGIALGKQNARIEYHGDDEIGRLVQAYNKKVSELAESAAMLARSERESAWKEMARQIAHEINNPLTPMKLNIQYLQKIKDEGSPNFDDYFNSVTRMLVAQIDALSSIASAFSDFARMPSTRIEPVEMVGLIREIVTLFDAPGEYLLTVSYPEEPVVFVSGDRDQFRRALVNVVRNATQAIQNQSNGSIKVRLEVLNQRLTIAIHDNGQGIPETDRERLFEPNFTTKSGGMGLGLAISKSIMENYRGSISFQCLKEETIFHIDLPLADLKS